MSLEIERKFLVKGEGWRGLAEAMRIRQGYVATKDGTTVRVRVAGNAAFGVARGSCLRKFRWYNIARQRRMALKANKERKLT